MYCSIGLLLTLTCALSQAVDETKNKVPGINPRIVGGQPAADGQFPFQAFLYATQNNAPEVFCSGILVAEDKVLTSIICAHQRDLAQINVGAGNIQFSTKDPTVVKKVTSVVDNMNPGCEISILNLESKFDLTDNIKTAKLSDTKAAEGTKCTVSGWGNNNGTGFVNNLNYVDVSIVTDGNQCNLDSGTGYVCSSSDGGKDACLFDHGGPLVCGNEQILTGVIFASACGNFGPTHNTDVFHCRDWIDSQINSAVILSKYSLVVYVFFVMLARWISRS